MTTTSTATSLLDESIPVSSPLLPDTSPPPPALTPTPFSTKQQPTSMPRIHSESAYVVFYMSLALLVYHWRFGSLLQVLFALSLCLASAPDRFAMRSYKTFMDWPDSWVLNYKAPSERFVMGLTAPLRFIHPVKAMGIENIPSPSERILFVGNHQIWALDVALKFSLLYIETGMYVRAITDRSHGNIPFFKHLIMFFGGVPGSREATQALMDRGAPLLIYPGGAMEVFKGKDDDPYALYWKDRTGFARMAAENGYTIVPFASVGMADAVKILFTIPAKYFWTILGDTRAKKYKKRHHRSTPNFKSDSTRTSPPKSSPQREMGDGIPILAPYLKPQTNYLYFGPPLDAKALVEKMDAEVFDTSMCSSTEEESDASFSRDYRDVRERSIKRLRDKVKEEVERGVEECLKWRDGDPERFTDVVGKVVGIGKGVVQKHLATLGIFSGDENVKKNS
ncbi:hypothetical protein BC829DRAFT_450427 [Chytridium lagenaria]|nr:hypothetical protein BC829DRAFT_450427 [Chytridium lagenaria]